MTERDPTRLADELEQEADALERRSEQLQEEAENVREDWARKRNDPDVPGTPPPDRGGRSDSRDVPPPEADFPAKTPSHDDE